MIQRLSHEVALSIGFIAGADGALLEALLRAADKDFLGTTQGGGAFNVGSLPLTACALCKPVVVRASSSLRGGGGGGFFAGTGALGQNKKVELSPVLAPVVAQSKAGL